MTHVTTCHDIQGNLYERDSEQLQWRPSVYGLLIKDGKILLSKQYDGYDFPGGGVDKHETLDQALRREFWEETGLDVKVGSIIQAQTSFYYYVKREQGYNCPIMYFLVDHVAGEVTMANLSASELEYVGMAEWIPLDQIGQIKFYNAIDSPALIRRVAGL